MAKRSKRGNDSGAEKTAPTSLWLNMIGSGCVVGSTEGQMRLARLCHTLLFGSILMPDDARVLASALLPLVLDSSSDTEKKLADFAKSVGLNKKQGRQPQGIGFAAQMAQPVVQYLRRCDELMLQGDSESTAQAKARAEACALVGIGDRAMRNRIAQYKQLARRELELQAALFGRFPELSFPE